MIEISNVTKKNGKNNVISNFSFSAERQECLGMFGADATAKTTLFKIIAGSIHPSMGHVNILGFDTQKHVRQACQAVGYQPATFGHPSLSVSSLLSFIAALRGFRGADKRKRLDKAVARLELSPLLKYPINALPPSLKRKVAIAQAILHDPAVLLLDEPYEGLASHQYKQITTLIQSLTEEMTVIIATRDCEALVHTCTRGLIVGGGRLLEDASITDLLRSSRHFQAVTLTSESALDLLALAVLPGVAGIEEDHHRPDTVTVLAMPGHSIFPSISALIAKRHWQVNSLKLEPGRLTDVVQHLSQEAPL